ncbi:MAG: Rrf2 family transcriptional regulator [Verrucomicrobia bacterium]|nr:Rrf2 family transcriptional regulator [Cytophagales bacterium]
MLSKKAKYALKALVVLVRNDTQEAMQIGEIAKQELIPKKFLEQILLELRNHGILYSRRGKAGGYALLKNPAEISIAEIMRVIDGPMAFTPCSSKMLNRKCDECKDEKTCEVRQVMIEARIAFCEVLEKTSLQDLIKQETEIMQ